MQIMWLSLSSEKGRLMCLLCDCRGGYGATAGNSRTLVDVTGKSEKDKEKKEGVADSWVARNEKTAELWRPGSGFKPTTFANSKGPKVWVHQDLRSALVTRKVDRYVMRRQSCPRDGCNQMPCATTGTLAAT